MQYFFSSTSEQIIVLEMGESIEAHLYDDVTDFVMGEKSDSKTLSKPPTDDDFFYELYPLTRDGIPWRRLSLVEVEYIRVKLTTSKRSPVGKDVREACKDALW